MKYKIAVQFLPASGLSLLLLLLSSFGILHMLVIYEWGYLLVFLFIS